MPATQVVTPPSLASSQSRLLIKLCPISHLSPNTHIIFPHLVLHFCPCVYCSCQTSISRKSSRVILALTDLPLFWRTPQLPSLSPNLALGYIPSSAEHHDFMHTLKGISNLSTSSTSQGLAHLDTQSVGFGVNGGMDRWQDSTHVDEW